MKRDGEPFDRRCRSAGRSEKERHGYGVDKREGESSDTTGDERGRIDKCAEVSTQKDELAEVDGRGEDDFRQQQPLC